MVGYHVVEQALLDTVLTVGLKSPKAQGLSHEEYAGIAAERWPDGGVFADYDYHNISFYRSIEDAEEHAECFCESGVVLCADLEGYDTECHPEGDNIVTVYGCVRPSDLIKKEAV